MSDVTMSDGLDRSGGSEASSPSFGQIMAMGPMTYLVDQVDTGGYYRVFRHAVLHDLIGEGLPSAIGFVGDVGKGLWDSGVDLVTEGDLTNPFNRVTRADGYTARLGRWGSEYIGQNLADFSGAGDVEFRKPDDGGFWDWEYRVDSRNDFQETNFGIGTIKVAGSVADIAIPGMALTKLRHLKTVGGALQKTGYGVIAGGLGGIVWDAVDTGDAGDLLKLLNDSEALNDESGIRKLQRSLNEVNKSDINASIENVHKQQRAVREGDITGETAEDIMGYGARSFLDDNGVLDIVTAKAFRDASVIIMDREALAVRAANVKHYGGVDDVVAHQSMLRLEQKFYGLVEDYMDNPEGFDPSQSDLLAMQMWMSGDSTSRFYDLGLSGKEETLNSVHEYLENVSMKWHQDNAGNVPPRELNADQPIVTDVNPTGSFNHGAENASIQEFLVAKQEDLGVDLGMSAQKLDELYTQKIESMRYMAL